MKNWLIGGIVGLIGAHLFLTAIHNAVNAVQYIGSGYPFAWQAWLYLTLCIGFTVFVSLKVKWY